MTPVDDTLTALADASNAYDALCHKMAINQLSPILDQLIADEDKQAGILRDAIIALDKPNGHIREIESQMQEARDKAENFRSRINNPMLSVDDRIQARGYAPFYTQEAEALAIKLEQARRDLEIYQAEVNKARLELEAVTRAKVGCGEGIIEPFRTVWGQATAAFTYYLAAHLPEIILNAGENESRWEPAMALMERMALASGFRTDGITAKESLAAKNMWQDYLTNQITPQPETQLSGAEVVRQQYLSAMSLKRNNDRIEDLRGIWFRNTHISSEVRNQIAAGR